MATKTKKAETKMVLPKIPLSRSRLGYTTSNVFKMPLKKVWDAVLDPKVWQKLFVDKQKGKFGPDLAPVVWNWKAWGDWTIYPIRFVKEKEIVFLAPDMEGKYLLTVRFEFVRKGGKTIFRIHEQGYPKTQLRMAFTMCEGWTEFHTALKFYLMTGKAIK